MTATTERRQRAHAERRPGSRAVLPLFVGFVAFVLVAVMLLAGRGCAGAAGPQPAEIDDSRDDSGSVSRDVRTMNLVDRHPNGSILAVDEVTIRSRSIALGVRVVNGYLREIDLARQGWFNYDGMYLLDNLGNAYAFDRQADVGVDPGAELVGTIVFLGQVDPEATSFTLVTNIDEPAVGVDLRDRSRDDATPQFYIEGIPTGGGR